METANKVGDTEKAVDSEKKSKEIKKLKSQSPGKKSEKVYDWPKKSFYELKHADSVTGTEVRLII